MNPDTESPVANSLSDWQIPATVNIGVTGHRKLNNIEMLKTRVDSVLDEVERMVDSILHGLPYLVSLVTPLADGADRLVARSIMTRQFSPYELSPRFDIVLPFERQEYAKTFIDDQSRQEFDRLVTRIGEAGGVEVLTDDTNVNRAYLRTGRHVVDHCDILIAIWNGKRAEGTGGTAEIVDYARGDEERPARKPVIQIHSETGDVSYYPDKTEIHEFLRQTLGPVMGYLRESPAKDEMAIGVHWIQDSIRGAFHDSSNGDNRAGATIDYIEKQKLFAEYAALDSLAAQYQKKHERRSTLIPLFALGSVFAIALSLLVDWAAGLPQEQVHWLVRDSAIWAKGWHLFSLLDVVLIVLGFGIYGLARRARYHQKWLDYRYLAERLRALIFMKSVGQNRDIHDAPPHISVSGSVDDWTTRACNLANRLVKANSAQIDRSTMPLLREAWLRDQRNYYHSSAAKFERKNARYEMWSLLLLAVTLIVSAIDFVWLGVMLPLGANEPSLGVTFAFLSIVLPAAGAFIAGLKNFKDLKKLSHRYRNMANMLDDQINLMNLFDPNTASDKILEIIDITDELMMKEHQGWREVVHFHELELA